MRQTNVVWVCYGAAAASLRLVAKATAGDGAADVHATLRRVWPRLLIVLTPAAAVAACFIAFVAGNGGALVVGDAAHHAPVLHAAQVAYLVALLGAYILPDALGGALAAACGGQAGRSGGLWWRALGGGAVHAKPGMRPGEQHSPARLLLAFTAQSLAVAWLLARYSYDHPFLLADNRHYAFYVWRRLLADTARRVSLAPVYVACGWLAMSRLSVSFEPSPLRASRRGFGTAAAALWLAASAAVLVPAQLIEPRYFGVPLAMALLHTRYVSEQGRW